MTRLAVLVAACIVASACAPSNAAPSATASSGASPTPRPVEAVTFMAGFKAQANLPFVGVYVAQKRGYFHEQGLDVTIQHSAGSGEHIRLLGTGAVQFSTGSAGDVMKRVADAGVPLVSVATIGQRGEQAYAVRADSTIRAPKDWEGRLVGYKGTVSADYLALLKLAGVDRSKVREVPVGFDPRVLVLGQVEVYPVFTSNEPDTLERLGVPVRLFEPWRFGVPSLGLTYITTRDMVASRADTVRRFLAAALKGIADAVADRAAAVDIVMEFAPGEDRAHQRYMLDTEIEAALTDLTRAQGIGATQRGDWARLHDVLAENGGLSKPIDVDAVSTDRFTKDLCRDGRLVWP
jgi:ABC-type nitrate/sulfonate/bicarbonate transport system substrate-binding protein